MSDTTTNAAAFDGSSEFGTFTEAGDYIPRTILDNDLGSLSFEEAIDGTIVEFQDGDIVNGTVVKVDRDEVLLDIGFKSEGVIPARELSIRNDVNPSEIVAIGDAIEALVHISEMSAHHVDLPEQVVTPGEELWVKIIDLDLQRRRISLSIKQAAEGGVVAAEYQDAFGVDKYDAEGNYIGDDSLETNAAGVVDYTEEARQAWREYYEQYGEEAYRQAVNEYGAGDDPAGVLNDEPEADAEAAAETDEA